MAVNVPSGVFVGKPVGPNTVQIYQFYANGSAKVSDNAGHSFAWHLIDLSAGNLKTSLIANSTFASQNFIVTNPASNAVGASIENVTVSYAIKYQECYPIGVEMTIRGSASQEATQTDAIGLQFIGTPLKTTADNITFATLAPISTGLQSNGTEAISGPKLTFDWSGSTAYHPAYNRATNMITWRVGSSFTIDPVIVGASSGTMGSTDDRKLFYAEGLYWLFYSDGTNIVLRTASSNNTSVWSDATIVSTATGSISTLNLGVWLNQATNTVYYALTTSGTFNTVAYRYGVLGLYGNRTVGFVSWSISETTLATSRQSAAYGTSILTDSSGHIWIAVREGSTADCFEFQVFEYTTSWSTIYSSRCEVSGVWSPVLLPLTSGIGVLFQRLGRLWIMDYSYSSSSWSTAVGSTSSYTLDQSSAVALHNTIYVAGSVSTGGIKFFNYTYGGSSTSAEQTIDSSSTSWYAGLTLYSGSPSATLAITYGSGSTIYYVTSSSNGTSWTPATRITGAESSLTWLTTPYSLTGPYLVAAWSLSSVNNVRFSSIPVTIPQAGVSTNSWSRSGVSPYETYFNNLNEYVSPGNGLLAVGQTDFSLAGRGISLDIDRLFTTPGAFYGSSLTDPYQYDNYTLTNLGYGWSLALPWMGTYYLHLSNGQEYPYSWTANVFQYNGVADFQLVKNTGGTYTLHLADGSAYQFNSAKQLTSITDNTGNNTLSFSYGSNTYISQITDTISRTATFAYNTNNTLASISSGGRTVNYYYSGHDLSSVKDAAGRITYYQYSTGVNKWLMSAILYPTGGKTTYTYGNAPVGTEVKTYYVTARNIYSSLTQLSQTDSISYQVLNGAVTSSDMTLSNGTAVQGYEDYVFSSGYKPFMRLLDINSTSSVTTLTESDYDAAGQVNETKTLNPSSILSLGLVGYWPLNEGSGTTTADASGNGNTGTLTNGPTWVTSGCEFGDCLSFVTASSQYVATTPNTILSSEVGSNGQITLSAWVNVASFASAGMTVIAKGGVSGGHYEYGMYLSSGGYPLITLYTSTGANICSAEASISIPTSTWTMITGTYSAALGRCTEYVDATHSGTAISTGLVTAWSSPLDIGQRPDTYGPFGGKIDDVRVYGVALSAGEVNELYTATSPPVTQTLAYSESTYDNWGNVIFTRDPMGQEAWYSYANTNSQNIFSTTGFSNTFYTNNSISANIHDALVGEADWQNGPTPATLALDGSAHCSSGLSNTCNMVLSTGQSNDVIIVISSSSSGSGTGAFATPTASGLTFSNRVTETSSSTNAGAMESYAIASSPLSSTSITCTQSGNPSARISCAAFAISGANTASPFDSGSGLPCTGTAASSATASCSLSTSNANDLIIGALGSTMSGSSITAGTGFTIMTGACPSASDGDSDGSACAESDIVSSTQSSLSVGMTLGSSTTWVFIGDAIKAAPAVAQETYLKYSTHGELLTQKVLHNGAWVYTTYTYDKYGNRITMTDAMGTTTHYHYSSTYSQAYLTLTSVMVGAVNNTQSNTYSSTTGYLLSETDGNGKTTSYSYDNIGRTTQITYPAIGGVSATTMYSYNDASDYVTITNQNGNVVKQNYDGLARMISIQTYNSSSIYSTESYTYNWNNQVATDTLPSSSVYKYTYNQDGQQIKAVNPDSTTVTTSYNVVANTKTVTDDNGHPTVYTYDWDGRLISVKQYYSSTGYYTTSYTYDLSGNLLTTTDPNTATTTYKYDDLNRLVKTIYPDNSYQTQSYNKIGDMTGEVNAGGTLLNYTYDALNRLTQVSYPGGSTLKYTYDGDGNVLSLVNSAVSTYYTYDALDRGTNQTQLVSGHKYSILYGYDKAGNVKSMVYPDGTNISMKYDFLNRVTKVGSLATLTYTTDSTVSKIVYGDGEVTTYTYNGMDRPSRVDLKTSGGIVRMDLNYTYDGDGNVKTINTESYSYNWLDELTSASGPWGSTTYAYDPAGNMLNQTIGGVTTKYTYGSYSRLSSIGKVNFTYDGNGNTHTIDNGSTLWTYNYDYNNRLTQAESNGVTVAQYSYDGNGMLVQSIEKNTQVYAYQGGNQIYTKNTGSGSVADYLYAGGMIVASINGTTTDYYHEDALGSVRIVSSSTQTTLFSTDYKPYGPLYAASGSVAFEYTGKPTDAATGLYYSGARFYDPSSARFMTEDSVVGNQNVPLTLNRYIYALDNPMTLIDPTGHMVYSNGKVVANVVAHTTTTTDSSGSTVTTTSVTVIPVPPPPLWIPAVTPPNVAPQTSTNSAASTPSNSYFIELGEQQAANAASSQPAASQSAETTTTPSATTNTGTNTPSTIQGPFPPAPPSTSSTSYPPGYGPSYTLNEGQAIVTSILLTIPAAAGAVLAIGLILIPDYGPTIGLGAENIILGGIAGTWEYTIGNGTKANASGALSEFGKGEVDGLLSFAGGWFGGL